MCVSVCVCLTQRERVCVPVQEEPGSQCSVFKENDTSSLLCLSADYTTTGDSPFGLFRRFRLPGTPVRARAKTTDLALVNRASG